MVDDIFFDFLHIEMVNVFCPQNANDSKEINVSKLEEIGFMTGYRFSEKSTKDCQRFKDELDVMKFICKEFWSSLFKKQIDNLRTNHQGVYVLLDNKFRFLTQTSNGKQYLDLLPKYLAFTCGLIRGALSNLGIVSIVTAEVVVSPSCRFQVQVQRT
ncbi:trafficking protein particle complex subunit 6B-like protein [Dinothrombium tinctorium]|uniref:Trafficking protein particle complex subunit 6B n=1 Tax=Dinothrombium tinctorium TaxID=1965070 RepID=A0A443QYA7_9ACAR|nr:trafficking protein particle complex subunit 6B-like protein [Dinothrombium tinctorium]